jgi:steroid 5-alpha reductase family enzyme
MIPPALQILLGLLFVVGLMSLLWFVQRRTGNAGIVDVAWAGAIGVLGLFFVATAAGDANRRLLAVFAPYWWIALVIPLLLLYFVLFVTGIPPTEAQAVASRGEDYRRYQQTTSAFVPWFPRRNMTHQ